MRFEIQPFANAKIDKAGALKPLEEAAEVFGAWQGGTRIDMLNECIDVIQAVVNLLYADGYTQAAIEIGIENCRRRNELRGRRYTEWGCE